MRNGIANNLTLKQTAGAEGGIVRKNGGGRRAQRTWDDNWWNVGGPLGCWGVDGWGACADPSRKARCKLGCGAAGGRRTCHSSRRRMPHCEGVLGESGPSRKQAHRATSRRQPLRGGPARFGVRKSQPLPPPSGP